MSAKIVPSESSSLRLSEIPSLLPRGQSIRLPPSISHYPILQRVIPPLRVSLILFLLSNQITSDFGVSVSGRCIEDKTAPDLGFF